MIRDRAGAFVQLRQRDAGASGRAHACRALRHVNDARRGQQPFAGKPDIITTVEFLCDAPRKVCLICARQAILMCTMWLQASSVASALGTELQELCGPFPAFLVTTLREIKL